MHERVSEKAVNETASRVSALWLSFITTATYLAIATGSVTHKNLLHDTPIKLPILNTELPLVGFFVVAPLLFLSLHFFFLLNCRILHQYVLDYIEHVNIEILSEQDPLASRQKLDSFALSWLPLDVNDRSTVLPFRAILFITMVIVPVAVFLQMQTRFLPYHQEELTTFHRAVVCLDIALMLALAETILFSAGPERRRNKRGHLIYVCLAGAFLIFVFTSSIFVISYPGEAIYRYRWPLLNGLLFEGEIDPVTSRTGAPFANRLILADQLSVESDKLAKLDVVLSLRGRDLRHAIFDRTDLRQVDFTGADLTGASLVSARLQKARMGCAEEKLQKGCTILNGANLSDAQLAGANFRYAQLQGAILVDAKAEAQPDPADFYAARLTGADLHGANVSGVDLTSADLRGASLSGAQINNTIFVNTQLDGAAFTDRSIKEAGLKGHPDAPTVWNKHKEQTTSKEKFQRELANSLIELVRCDTETDRDLSHRQWRARRLQDRELRVHILNGLRRNEQLNHVGPYSKEIEAALEKTCDDTRALR